MTHEQFDQAFWDERYRSHPTALWSGQPNAPFVREADGLDPGTALDVGCGEGADAMWLAGRGWSVTAVDLSEVALQRATSHADRLGPEIAARIEWVHEDVTTWDPGLSRFDLVSAQYIHLPSEPRRALFGRLAAAVTRSGTLLLVAHHPSDLETTVQRPQHPDWFFTGDEIAASLDSQGWDVITNAAPGRVARDPEGNTVTVHDSVFRARRRR